MLSLFGQVGQSWRSWGFGEIAIAVVIFAAVIALVFIALRQFNVSIPQWVINCAWIVCVTFVVVVCIKLVLSM